MQPYQHQIIHKLNNGQEFFLRMVLSEDKSRFREGFKLLSAESRYTRFFGYLKALSESQLEYLSNVDQLNHVAWGVQDPTLDTELGIGVGRFIRVETCPNCAEIALTVIDEYQSKGIGTLLLGLLYVLAEAHEIEFFTGSMLAQNHRFLDRLKKIGAEVTGSDGIFDFKLPIYKDGQEKPQNEFTERWENLLQELRQELFNGV